MKYKDYTKYIVTTLFIIVSTSFLIGWQYFHFQEIEGDLTRIGMHSEDNYGNNGVEYYFKPALSSKGSVDNIDTYDIIVIGDSFSNHRFSRAWHNYLQRETGFKIGVFKINDLNKIIASSKYKASPPKIIIYESVERELYNRHYKKISEGGCLASRNELIKIKLKLNPVNVEPYSIKRNTNFSFKVDLGIKFLREKIKITPKLKTRTLNLTTSDLFTNKYSEKLLIYGDDIENKKRLLLSDWRGVYCNLLELQKKIQRNKQTKFITLIAPDKLTIYSSYIKSKEWEDISYYQYLTENNELNAVPLLRYFKDALKRNKKDIYLSNDTHWGSAGNELVGRAVLDYFKRVGIIGD